MVKRSSFVVPSLYIAGYLNGFEDLVASYDVEERTYAAGELLTRPGRINNTAFFVRRGLFRFSVRHDAGEKSLNIFGEGTMFPVGVELHEYWMEYEMVMRALTDLSVYAMPYPVLKQIVRENGDFAGELLRENCDFIGYLLMDSVNQAFEPCLARLADVLYLYVTKVNAAGSDVVTLTQSELAGFVGASQAQFERSLKILRKEGVIETARGSVTVLDRTKLLAHCSLGLQQSV